MSKLHDENLALLKDVIAKKNLPHFKWETVSNPKLKPSKGKSIFPGRVIFPKSQLNEITGIDVVFEINEDLFDRLSDYYQLFFLEKLVAYIGYDSTKEKIISCKPEFIEHESVLLKYEPQQCLALKSAIAGTFEKMKEENSKTNNKD